MEILTLSLIGAVLALDTTAVFQGLISQPLIACTLLGWAGNEVALGLQIGFLMQLLWMSNMPVGAVHIPEGNVGAMASVILAIQMKPFFNTHYDVIVLCVILFSLVLSFAGGQSVQIIRNCNISLLTMTLKRLEDGKTFSLGLVNLLAILFYVSFIFALIVLSVWIGRFILLSVINRIPVEWNTYAQYVETALLGVGVGLTLHLYKEKKQRMALLLVALAAFIIFSFFVR